MEELKKKPIDRVMIKNINEYTNLRNDFNTFGGRRNKKKDEVQNPKNKLNYIKIKIFIYIL